MSSARVLHLPGNGHAPVRFAAARPLLEERGITFVEAADPLRLGTASPDDDFESWLTALATWLEREVEEHGAFDLVHASGIGALVALSLRARGALEDTPIVFQGPVLWGLEKRRFPRLMRRRPFPSLLCWLFGRPAFRRRFARKYFEAPLTPTTREAFFEGYADRRAFLAWFRWLTPERLRQLEKAFAKDPATLETITVWIGGRDHVVGAQELAWTAEALGVEWPVVHHEAWGHYPMMDDPESWVEELSDAVAATVAVR